MGSAGGLTRSCTYQVTSGHVESQPCNPKGLSCCGGWEVKLAPWALTHGPPMHWLGLQCSMSRAVSCVQKHLLRGHRQRDEQSWTQNRPVKTLAEKTKLSLYKPLTCWPEKQQPASGGWPRYHAGDTQIEPCWLKYTTSQPDSSLSSILGLLFPPEQHWECDLPGQIGAWPPPYPEVKDGSGRRQGEDDWVAETSLASLGHGICIACCNNKHLLYTMVVWKPWLQRAEISIPHLPLQA